MIRDLVLSVNSDSGESEFSPIILFLDQDPNKAHQFFIIQTESGHSLTLTPTHLIYTSNGHLGHLRVLLVAFAMCLAAMVFGSFTMSGKPHKTNETWPLRA